jgi:hypothetical protein
MPTVACRICGRVVYTTAPFEDLFAEESRCPRCGGVLFPERRDSQRRKLQRRQNPPDDPGPPDGHERRVSDRRRLKRRRDDNPSFTP